MPTLLEELADLPMQVGTGGNGLSKGVRNYHRSHGVVATMVGGSALVYTCGLLHFTLLLEVPFQQALWMGFLPFLQSFELRGDGLKGIVDVLRSVPYLRQLVVSIDGTRSRADYNEMRL